MKPKLLNRPSLASNRAPASPRVLPILTLCASVILALSTARGQVLTWNNGSGNQQWDTVSQNWGGTTLWNNTTPDSAIFGATGAGAVTVANGITVNDITLTASGYNIMGSALTLGGASPGITNDGSNTILSAISGSHGLNLYGNGLLNLSNNPVTGGTVIYGGTVYCGAANASPGTFGDGNVLIKRGATVLVGGDNSLFGSSSATYTCTIQGAITNGVDAPGSGSICKMCNLVFDGGVLYSQLPNENYGDWDFIGNISTPGDGSSSAITGGNAALYGGSVFNIGTNDTLTINTILIALSGDPSVLQKTGSGTLTLNAVNLYDGMSTKHTFVNIGLNIAGGLLDGNGSVAGAVTVAAHGTLGAGTPSAIGQFGIANTLAMSSGSTTLLRLNAAAGTNDSLVGMSTVTYGGTLVVTNLAGTLALGDTFQLFEASNYVGQFTATNLPALNPGLSWNWSPTNGTLSITTAPVPVTVSIAPASGNVVSLNFSGQSGHNYTVVMTTNLALPISAWTPLATGVFGAGPATFTDNGATNAMRFYDIISQ